MIIIYSRHDMKERAISQNMSQSALNFHSVRARVDFYLHFTIDIYTLALREVIILEEICDLIAFKATL